MIRRDQPSSTLQGKTPNMPLYKHRIWSPAVINTKSADNILFVSGYYMGILASFIMDIYTNKSADIKIKLFPFPVLLCFKHAEDK